VERWEHEPTSPAGQVDAWGDFASGLRSNRAGRRRAMRMLGWLVAVVVVLTAVLVLVLSLR
jgi:t-SNARE complex subunit (syntaxin)